MNMHHITKSLFVGAAIAGIGMSSGRADVPLSGETRAWNETVKKIKPLFEKIGTPINGELLRFEISREIQKFNLGKVDLPEFLSFQQLINSVSIELQKHSGAIMYAIQKAVRMDFYRYTRCLLEGKKCLNTYFVPAAPFSFYLFSVTPEVTGCTYSVEEAKKLYTLSMTEGSALYGMLDPVTDMTEEELRDAERSTDEVKFKIDVEGISYCEEGIKILHNYIKQYVKFRLYYGLTRLYYDTNFEVQTQNLDKNFAEGLTLKTVHKGIGAGTICRGVSFEALKEKNLVVSQKRSNLIDLRKRLKNMKVLFEEYQKAPSEVEGCVRTKNTAFANLRKKLTFTNVCAPGSLPDQSLQFTEDAQGKMEVKVLAGAFKQENLDSIEVEIWRNLEAVEKMLGLYGAKVKHK